MTPFDEPNFDGIWSLDTLSSTYWSPLEIFSNHYYLTKDCYYEDVWKLYYQNQLNNGK